MVCCEFLPAAGVLLLETGVRERLPTVPVEFRPSLLLISFSLVSYGLNVEIDFVIGCVDTIVVSLLLWIEEGDIFSRGVSDFCFWGLSRGGNNDLVFGESAPI